MLGNGKVFGVPVSQSNANVAPMSAPSQQLFGIVIPGRPIHSEFQLIGATKAVTFIMTPGEVSEITFFLLPNVPIPFNCGAVVCYSIPPYEQWNLLGSVNPTKPSAIFHTNWQIDPEIKNAPYLQFGISINSMEEIRQAEAESPSTNFQYELSQRTALDFYTFMVSMSQLNIRGGTDSNTMLTPMNIFDRWKERFDRKFMMDPYFVLAPKEEGTVIPLMRRRSSVMVIDQSQIINPMG